LKFRIVLPDSGGDDDPASQAECDPIFHPDD